MSARASILTELRELRRLAELRLPKAERVDVCRRIRAYQRELKAIRESRAIASNPPVCRECKGAILWRPIGGRVGPFCSATCREVYDDKRVQR